MHIQTGKLRALIHWGYQNPNQTKNKQKNKTKKLHHSNMFTIGVANKRSVALLTGTGSNSVEIDVAAIARTVKQVSLRPCVCH